MLTTKQIRDMLQTQRKLNEQINPLWESAGNDWDSAILVETAEATDHLGWKWWKHSETNIPGLQMELVDIWHFLLSKLLESCSTDEDALEYIIDAIEDSNYLIATRNTESIVKLLQEFVVEELGEDSGTATFLVIVCQAGMTHDDLYKMYTGKNILNKFRQDNGYKDGTYIKTWLAYKEDNDYLTTLLNEIPIDTENYADIVYQGLALQYKYVKGANE